MSKPPHKQDLGMPFDFDDVSMMVSHWMLQSPSVSAAIAQTPDFQQHKTLTARVEVNGVELPFAVLESYLRDTYTRMQARLEAHYANQEALVQARARDLLAQKAQPLLDSMARITTVLEDPDNLLASLWVAPGDTTS